MLHVFIGEVEGEEIGQQHRVEEMRDGRKGQTPRKGVPLWPVSRVARHYHLGLRFSTLTQQRNVT